MIITDLISIITLSKAIVYSKDKQSYESTLIFAKLWVIKYAVPLFTLIRYLLLL